MADAWYTIDMDEAQLAKEVRPTLVRTTAMVTRRVSTRAKQKAPVDTGNLARSIQEDPIRQVGPFRVESGVTATARYAKFVHDGTRPHVIRPRTRRFLKFEVNGQTVFAREVHHPGTRPRPFLRNAAEEVAAELHAAPLA